MITELLIYKILQLFVMMIIGFLIAKAKIIDRAGSLILSKLSLYLLMPAAIINAFDFESSTAVRNGLLFSFSAAIIIHIIFILLDMLYGKFISNHAVERASIMYSNAGNLIIPIVSFVLGPEWVVFSATFLSVQLFFLWSHGVRLFRPQEEFDFRKVLFNVNIISILLGVVMMIFGIRLPVFVKDITSSFGSMLGPVGMLITGVLAAEVDFKKVLSEKRLYRAVFFKLLAYPFIIMIALKLLSFVPVVDGEKILLVSFLAAIAPTAATIMQFSQINNSDTEYATAINICTTIACVITMPFWVMIFSSF